MKLRFTFGNIIAVVTTVAGLIKEAAPQLTLLIPGTGAKIVAIGAVIALATKGMASFNHDDIPDAKKVEGPGVVFEKTGPLKP